MRGLTDSERKAAAVYPPMSNSSTDTGEQGIGLFAMSTTHASSQIPDNWSGKFISVHPINGAVWISGNVGSAGQEVDRTVAAAADGDLDNPKNGKHIPSGEERHYQLPEWQSPRKFFLNYEADATGTLEVCLSST